MATNRPSPAALGLAPLVLRLALGALFAWAGLVKWCGTMPVKGDDAAVLATMGLIERPAAVAPATAPAPATPAPSAPLPTPTKPRAAAGGSLFLLAQTTPPGGASNPKPPTPVASAPPPLSALDFPEPVPCRGIWMIALSVHHAAHPEAGKMSLWPRVLGEGIWPTCFALVVLIFELGGGVCLLLGLFTRLAAFGVMSVMLGAMWLTQFGPAMQSGNAVFGILPAHDWKDLGAWQTLVLQGLSLSSAIALMCLGSGALAFDRALAGYRSTPPSKPASSSPVSTGGAGGR